MTETYPPEVNGVARTLHRVINAMQSRGHRVQLIRPRQGKDDPGADAGAEQTLLVMPIPMPWYKGIQGGMPAFLKLYFQWRRQRPDVIYVATEGPLGFAAVLVARYLKIPVLSGFHTNFPSYCAHYRLGFLSRLINSYLRAFHNRTAMTLVPTREMSDDLAKQNYQRTVVFGRGVDIELFSPEKRSLVQREAWGVQGDELVVLYVGRIAAEKNIKLAVRAFDAMCEKRSKLRFVFVGDGPVASELASGRDDLIFAGVHTGESLAAHYASADIFLFPSKTETFGNVILEAMASGLALVAYDYAAGKEVGGSGVNGQFVPFDDEQAFIDAAVTLLDDDAYRIGLAREARQRVLSCSWDALFDLFESYLTDARLGDGYERDQADRITSTPE
ncbi:MAG: glycosyltransferase family 1 protein [Chromatiales bacterium]|nr:glycosyltransferase family 1 protein [Chromatiales bacterium]